MESQGTSREGGSWTPLNLLANSPSRAAVHIVLGREWMFITRSQKGSETQTGTKGKSRAEGGLEYGKQPPSGRGHGLLCVHLSDLIQLCASSTCRLLCNSRKLFKNTCAGYEARLGVAPDRAGLVPKVCSSPAIAEQPACKGAVRCQPVHEGGSEQSHHQLHSEDRLGEGT